MQTFEDQLVFFNSHWPQLRSALESGGAAAGVAFINGTFSDDLERRVMYFFAKNGMLDAQWPGRNLDAYINVMDAGIAECLRQADAAPDEETKHKRINSANVLSYNLGADLACCWDDGLTRTPAHFTRGLKCGEDCLRWRLQLGNPPFTFAIAHWLRGIHRLALGDKSGALADFQESLRYAEVVAADSGKPTDLAGGDSNIVFGHGTVALTQLILGDTAARAEYNQVRSIFAEQLQSEDTEVRGDAEIYDPQLAVLAQRFGI
jgi:hypothetical protein